MGTGYQENLHISQFYETIMLILLAIPLTAYALVFRRQAWGLVNRKRCKQNDEYYGQLDQKEDTQIQRQIDSIQQNSRRQSRASMQKQQQPQGEQPSFKPQDEAQPPAQPQQRKSMLQQMVSKIAQDQDPEITTDQKRVMYFHQQITDVYQIHLPLIFMLAVISIILEVNQVVSLAFFYCYIISNFMLDYVQMFQRLKKQYQHNSIAPYVNLVSGCFAIAFFINLFTRYEYSLQA